MQEIGKTFKKHFPFRTRLIIHYTITSMNFSYFPSMSWEMIIQDLQENLRMILDQASHI